MPGTGTTKDENHPHPSLPRRGGGIQGGGIIIFQAKKIQGGGEAIFSKVSRICPGGGRTGGYRLMRRFWKTRSCSFHVQNTVR
jgi:hypothetical protein